MTKTEEPPFIPPLLESGTIDSAFLSALRDHVLKAGDAIMRIYGTDFEVALKEDRSPVTGADTLAEAILLEGLAELSPAIPVIAEESFAAGARPPSEAPELFWLVDALDGTREFVSRNGEFTVNVGLIHQGRPVFGMVYCPAMDLLYWGAPGGGAFLQSRQSTREISCRVPPEAGVTILASRRHGDEFQTTLFLDTFLKGRPVARQISAGSSLKFCRIAEGLADVYPRLGPTSEWDTAAAHAIVRAAGGNVTTLEGEPFLYGKAPYYRNPYFVAFGSGW
ncbi:3'(2'),5'-bisphosphate nucleotidase CysQ [Phaeovibrio sulfidiphilus]|uniref:3'(2'),5'-bisphosphate nucleotidase CysQ n=1 Tax=Phaeovibrio sulfidiphilus TaxID=1220600 RepID=UPI001F558CE2|nr:3'(2'),5'-bisphosphate nucleotidase CysQ [Phaeovibrio sulfidiphilus]